MANRELENILSAITGGGSSCKQTGNPVDGLAAMGALMGLASSIAGKEEKRELPSAERPNVKEGIDWEQRRFELVKIILPMFGYTELYDNTAKRAVEFADKVIEQLKNKRP